MMGEREGGGVLLGQGLSVCEWVQQSPGAVVFREKKLQEGRIWGGESGEGEPRV